MFAVQFDSITLHIECEAKLEIYNVDGNINSEVNATTVDSLYNAG